MYYVPEGTKTCGYYECKKCGNRFLSMQTMSRIPCPDCAAEIDYEIGPDETMEDVVDTAVLLEKIEGEEFDALFAADSKDSENPTENADNTDTDNSIE